MLISGCVTVESVKKGDCSCDGWGYMVCNNYDVEYISEPPGARIEINNNYIGNAPIVYRWHGYYVYGSSWTVKAYPSQPGQFLQVKVLNINQLPRRVYFNMNLGLATPTIDVNVNN